MSGGGTMSVKTKKEWERILERIQLIGFDYFTHYSEGRESTLILYDTINLTPIYIVLGDSEDNKIVREIMEDNSKWEWYLEEEILIRRNSRTYKVFSRLEVDERRIRPTDLLDKLRHMMSSNLYDKAEVIGEI